MFHLKLDPAKAVPPVISYQYDKNADPEGFHEGRTSPTDDGFAYITLTQTVEAEVKWSGLERYGYRSARKAGGAHDCS
jgi:hypothetical protein